MKTVAVWYQPIAEVEMTWSEVEGLALFAETHYDHKCRETAKQGGVVTEMRNRFDFPIRTGSENDTALRRSARIAVRLTGYDADLLAKVAESDPVMGKKLLEIAKKLYAEWRRANRENLRAHKR